MDSLASKIGIFLSGVILAKFIPSSFISVLIFFLGILLTLLFEIILFLYYVANTSEEYFPNAQGKHRKQISERCDSFNKSFIRKPKAIQMTKYPLERRFTMMQCICNGSKFTLLHSSNDTTLNDLAGILKEFLLTDKKYASGLVKLGEISLIEKIKKKKSMKQIRSFRNFCFVLGKKYIKETEALSEGLINDILNTYKDTVIKYKELSYRFRNAGEKFYSYANEIQKLVENLSELDNLYRKANSDFSEARKDLAQFETLVKKEMKLKKLNNESGNIKARISKIKDLMHEESVSFLPRAQDVMRDMDIIEKFIGQKYKSFVETWLKYTLGIINFCIENLEILHAEPKVQRKSQRPSLMKTVTFLKNTLNKTENSAETPRFRSFFSSFSSADSQNSTYKLVEKKIDKLEDYTTDIIKFFTFFICTEEEAYKDTLRILNFWKNIDNIYIEEPINDIKNSIIDMKSSNKDFRVEVFSYVTKLKDFLEIINNFRREALQYDSSVEDSLLAENRFKDINFEYRKIVEETKDKVIVGMLKMHEKNKKYLRKIVENFDVMDDLSEILSFNNAAKVHRPQCPCYIVSFDDDKSEKPCVKEPDIAGEPESANWLNDLLDSFMSEWRHSPRFISYICRKLKKIYNKDNPEYIGEIEIKKVEIGDQSPEVKDFTPLETENDLEFYYEFELLFRGDIKIHLEFDIKWSVASLPVNVIVVLRSFYSKLRFFFSPSKTKCSWYSFVSEPVHQISIEPVIGKMNKIALSKIPQINTLLVSAFSRKLRKYVWPNKRSIKIFKGNKSEIPLE